MKSLLDSLYLFEIKRLIDLQNTFSEWSDIFVLINKWSDPAVIINFVFPVLCSVDSKFASELLLTISAQGWLISILNWCIREDRPFWWLKETNLTKDLPVELTSQTCKTSYGTFCPNTAAVTTLIILITSWISSIIDDKDTNRSRWLRKIFIFLKTAVPFIIIIAQSFNVVNFFHQGILGFILSFCLTGFIPLWFMKSVIDYDDEYAKIVNIKREKVVYGRMYRRWLFWKMLRNIMYASMMLGITFGSYWGMKAYGINPLESVKLAFRRCPSTDYLHYSSTPQFVLVRDISSIFGLALSITPSIKNFRYDSRPRSLPIAVVSTMVFYQVFTDWQKSISTDSSVYFYLMMFVSNILKTVFLLRVGPLLSLGAGSMNIGRR